jgi:hypothetical protein
MRKVLEVDPTNETALKVIDMLTKPPKQGSAKPKGGPNQSTGK